MDDLIAGYRRFRATAWPERRRLFERPGRARPAPAGHGDRLRRQPGRPGDGVRCRAGRDVRRAQRRQPGAALRARRRLPRHQCGAGIRRARAAGAPSDRARPRAVRRHPRLAGGRAGAARRFPRPLDRHRRARPRAGAGHAARPTRNWRASMPASSCRWRTCSPSPGSPSGWPTGGLRLHGAHFDVRTGVLAVRQPDGSFARGLSERQAKVAATRSATACSPRARSAAMTAFAVGDAAVLAHFPLRLDPLGPQPEAAHAVHHGRRDSAAPARRCRTRRDRRVRPPASCRPAPRPPGAPDGRARARRHSPRSAPPAGCGTSRARYRHAAR